MFSYKTFIIALLVTVIAFVFLMAKTKRPTIQSAPQIKVYCDEPLPGSGNIFCRNAAGKIVEWYKPVSVNPLRLK